jgi:4-amino-4-deoxy-L-arabinose transferase-like glycosyltransferase
MQRWHARFARFAPIAGITLLAFVVTASLTRDIVLHWTYANGSEVEKVAHAWADGKGVAAPGKVRWLFDPTNPDDRTDSGGYYTTAWEEPVPIVVLGTFFWLFGDYGRLAMVITNALCFLATMGMVYYLARRCAGPGLGLASAALLALVPLTHHGARIYFGGSVLLLSGAMLAGLAVSICALLLLRLLERPSVRRALLLGGAIGFTALTLSTAIIFLPVAALLVLLTTGPLSWRGWRTTGAIVGGILLVISPWALRNYAVFGEFVPLRNGGGFVAYVGNRALAETLEPSLVPDHASLTPPWTASNLLDAVRRMDVFHDRHPLELYSVRAVRANAPDEYAKLNEAQRDRLFMRAALLFMWQHPLMTLELAVVKAVRFLYLLGRYWPNHAAAGLVGLLPVLGAALSLKDPRLRALGLMALAYAAVYAGAYPFFYRYRYPIEPVLAILGGVAIIWLVRSASWLRGYVPSTSASGSG